MGVAELLIRHEASWLRATRHSFLSAVRDGNLPKPAFDRWLAQDYRFVSDLLRLQARLLGRAPRPAQAVVAGGAVALVDELTWFEQQAYARAIDLGAAPRPATLAYGSLLGRLDDAEFPVALAMLWTLERAYLEAWSFAAPGAEAYRDFVAHWTTPDFATYVNTLEAAADDVSGGVHRDAFFLEVVEAEVQFWDMALEDAS